MSHSDVHHLTALLLRLLIKSNGSSPRFFYSKAIKAPWNLLLWRSSLLSWSISEPPASSFHPSNFREHFLCAGSMRTEPKWKSEPAQAQGSVLICLSRRTITVHTLCCCFVGCNCDFFVSSRYPSVSKFTYRPEDQRKSVKPSKKPSRIIPSFNPLP